METFHTKKTGIKGRARHRQPSTSFNRALTIYKSRPTSDLKVAKKGLSDTLLTRNDLQKINAHLLRIEKQKAYGIRIIIERQRYR